MCFDFIENIFFENIFGCYVLIIFVIFIWEMKYDVSLYNLIKLV